LVLIGDLFPVVNDCCPVENSTNGEQFRCGKYPPVSFPSNISNRIFNKSEKVFEPSLLVAFVNALLSKPELLEFPIVLLSHRSILFKRVPIGHLKSL
jgi:hypothetical protein